MDPNLPYFSNWPMDAAQNENTPGGTWGPAGGDFRYYSMWDSSWTANYAASTGVLALTPGQPVSIFPLGPAYAAGYEPKTCAVKLGLNNWKGWFRNPSVGQEGFNEPVMIRLSRGPREGRLICLMRTGNRVDPLYQTHSDDEGGTWSPPRPLPLKGVDPDLIEMADGTLACSFGYRILPEPSPPPPPEHGNYVAFSTDQGETWGHVTHLPIEPHSAASRSTCYTSLREVEPGKLLVLFDIGSKRSLVGYIGRRFVHVRRL